MREPMNVDRFRRQLRWYPSAWRVRYGDELVALMEDSFGDLPLSPRARLALARAGLAERLHENRFGADDPNPADRVRGGSLLVLCAWGFFLVGGAIFAKFTEHWTGVTPMAARSVPAAAYDVVQVAATVGAVVIALAVAVVLPAFVRFLRAGGWPEVRRAILTSAAVTTVAVGLGAGIVVWAHHIGSAQRNGGSALSAGLGMIFVLSVVTTIVTWTAASVRTVRRLDLAPSILRLEGFLSLVLTLTMICVIGGTVAWWVALATNAPWFLADGPTGVAGSPVPPALLVAGLSMVAGIGLAARGAGRVARALRPPAGI